MLSWRRIRHTILTSVGYDPRVLSGSKYVQYTIFCLWRPIILWTSHKCISDTKGTSFRQVFMNTGEWIMVWKATPGKSLIFVICMYFHFLDHTVVAYLPIHRMCNSSKFLQIWFELFYHTINLALRIRYPRTMFASLWFPSYRTQINQFLATIDYASSHWKHVFV